MLAVNPALMWLLACTTAPPGVATAPPIPAAFAPATLEPAFHHAASTWPGLALLDYDGDGWLDIFLTNGRSHANGLYRNMGDGQHFEDRVLEAGIDSLAESGPAVSGDLDNDGDPDLVVAVACSTGTLDEGGAGIHDGDLEIWLNQGDGTFARSALAVETDRIARCAVSLNLADLDGDGALDLVVSVQTDPDILPPWIFEKYEVNSEAYALYGDGAGSFDREGEDYDLHGTFVSTIFDADGDGEVDLLFGTSGQEVVALHPDGSPLPVGQGSGRGLWMGLAVADFDGDGALDLYGTNMGLSPFIAGYDNLWDLYEGSGVAEVGASADPMDLDAPPVTTIQQVVNPFHSLLHLAADGSIAPDPTWRLEADQLLAGDLFDGVKGRYPEWVAPRDLARQGWGWAAVAVDLDGDGWEDVAWNGNNCSAPMTVIWEEERGASPGGILHNQGDGGFVDWTWQLGAANLDLEGRYPDGRGLAVGDLDNDGHPDLVYANRGYNPTLNDPLAYVTGEPAVWLNPGAGHHWLEVELEGTVSNRDAVGALVEVDDGERLRAFPYSPGGALGSSSQRLLTVGLGEVEAVDVRVRFPSGSEVERTGVAADQRIHLVEGE